MSCSTLSQQAVRMQVSMGALPEGFCPENMQDLANAIATRLIVTPNQAFSSFAAGSVEPSSNVGPWFKDCTTWYIWDDSLAKYIPMTKGGFNTYEVFTTSNTFTVPEAIYKVMIEGWGSGGGGSDFGAGSGGGGGGGGYGRLLLDVVPGDSIVITIGIGGANGAVATAGTSTIIKLNAATVMTLTGGGAGDAATGALGGTVTGASFSIQGGSGSSANYGAGAQGGYGAQGGSGGVTGTNASVLAGQTPGGGGAGGTNGLNGGAGGSGANGETIIWY